MSDLPRPASNELIALAARARPDWSADQVRDVIAQARYAGISWSRLLLAVTQLIVDPEAQPGDLIPSAPELWMRRRTPPGPETAHRGAAAARAALTPPPDSST